MDEEIYRKDFKSFLSTTHILLQNTLVHFHASQKLINLLEKTKSVLVVIICQYKENHWENTEIYLMLLDCKVFFTVCHTQLDPLQRKKLQGDEIDVMDEQNIPLEIHRIQTFHSVPHWSSGRKNYMCSASQLVHSSFTESFSTALWSVLSASFRTNTILPSITYLIFFT